MRKLGNQRDRNEDEQPGQGRTKHAWREAHWVPLSGQAGARQKERDLGDDLLSQTVASPVPSALTGLTAVFGMGTGVSPSLWSPKSLSFDRCEEVLLGTAQDHAIN